MAQRWLAEAAAASQATPFARLPFQLSSVEHGEGVVQTQWEEAEEDTEGAEEDTVGAEGAEAHAGGGGGKGAGGEKGGAAAALKEAAAAVKAPADDAMWDLFD